ncbi:MAG: hypothetical protein KAH48_12680, partial [Chlorobi bacterium]|nr:hypothetical protein [Chlorobiota bacterium]
IYEELTADSEVEYIMKRLADLYSQTKNNKKYADILERILIITDDKSDMLEKLINTYIEIPDYVNTFRILSIVDTSVYSADDSENLFSIYGTVGNKLIEDSSEYAEKYISDYLDRIDSRFTFDWRINLIAAYLYNDIEDFVSSEKYIQKTLKVADRIPQIYLQISSLYFQNEKYHKVTELLESVEEEFEGVFSIPFYLGLAYSNLENYYDAIDCFEQAWEIDNSMLDARAQIGMIYDRMKKYDSSDAEYEYVLELDPLNPVVNNNYAYSLAVRDEDLEEALVMIKIAITAEPENSSYLDTYAWVLYKLERHDEALVYILKAIDFADESPDLYLHLGYIYSKLDKKELSIRTWKKGAELFPDNQELKSLLESK